MNRFGGTVRDPKQPPTLLGEATGVVPTSAIPSILPFGLHHTCNLARAHTRQPRTVSTLPLFGAQN